MAQWRKTFFSLGGPEYIPDPRVDEQVRLGQLVMAQQEAQRVGAERQAMLAQQAAEFQQRAREFDQELAMRREALSGQREDRALARSDADRLFAAQRADAERRFGLESQQEQRLAASAAEQQRLAQENLRLGEERLGVQRADDERRAKLAEEQAKRDWLFRNYVAPAQALTLEGVRSQRAEESQRAADERAAAALASREKIAEAARAADMQELERRQQAAEAKAAAERLAEEQKARAEAEQRRAYGITSSVRDFASVLDDLRAREEAGSLDTDLLPAEVERALRDRLLGGGQDEKDLDPVRGGARPGWRPTSVEDEQILAPILKKLIAERFPQRPASFAWLPFYDPPPVDVIPPDLVDRQFQTYGSELFRRPQ